MTTSFKNRVKVSISNTPSTTGDFVLSSAAAGYQSFGASDDGKTYDILITEGSAWEIRSSVYTHSSTTLSRGTLIESSTGSAINFTSAAVVINTSVASKQLSVNVSSPVSNQALTYNGSDWVNSTLSYAASGANSDITSLSGITGAIATADYVDFDTVNAQTPAVGRITWDATNGCLQYGAVGGNVNIQLGQEQVIYAFNGTGSPMTDGQIVYIVGAQGNNASIALASNSSETTSNVTIGMVTEPIANGARGFVTIAGMVNGLNTFAYNEGDQVWLGSTAGTWTTTKPVAPAHSVLVGYITRKHAVVGSVLVNVQNGFELDELHDVLISSATDTQILQYDGVNHYWKNVPITNVLPSQTGNTGKYLTTNGSTTSWATVSSSGGVDAIAVSFYGGV